MLGKSSQDSRFLQEEASRVFRIDWRSSVQVTNLHAHTDWEGELVEYTVIRRLADVWERAAGGFALAFRSAIMPFIR